MSNKEIVIGDNIAFSISKEMLYLIDSPEVSVTLTPACSRLLEYMISRQGVVLTRDAIFKNIWIQYGSTPSNSSLNTYISLIRKAFLSLGDGSEIIITIPKTGFLFNPDIKIEWFLDKKQDPELVSDATSDVGINSSLSIFENEKEQLFNQEESPSKSAPTSSLKLNIIKRFIDGNNVLIIILLITIITTLSLSYFTYKTDKIPPIAPIKIGMLGPCEVMFLPLHQDETNLLTIESIAKIVKNTGLTCMTEGIFYIYTDKRFMAGLMGKTFVSYCEVHRKSAKNCTDFIGINVKPSAQGQR